MNMRWVFASVAVIFATLSSSLAAEHTPETVATIPSPAFNENISEDTDGTFYVTGAFESNLWKISGGKAEKLAHFDQYAVILGVAALPDSLVVGAFRRDFRQPSGIDFAGVGSEILMLDKKTGKIVATAQGQKGQVFNGMVADGRGKVLITDSLGASVWQFDPQSRALSLWLKDDALASSSATALGANGIKVAGDWVYVANRDKLSIFRVRIDAGGKAQGPLNLVVKDLPHADDFAVAADGTIYLPPGDQAKSSPMLRIAPNGEVTPHAVGPAGASAMVSRDGKWVYWATNAGLAPKTPDPQRLLRVPAAAP
jgi:sugar lactone lactonase YvrE